MKNNERTEEFWRNRQHLTIIATILLTACGGGGGDSPNSVGGSVNGSYTASGGVAQKGPLILGSEVTAQELNSSLTPTGKQYSYQITSNLGTFNPTSMFTSQFIGLSATGYYYDEVANGISVGTITLNGVSDLSSTSTLNVNILTTLAYQRIINLVTKSGMTITAAQAQSENEVLAALDIRHGSSYGRFGSFDLSHAGDGDKILAAISSVFVYGNSSGQLASLIASFQSDIADNGVIDNANTKSTLLASAKALNPAQVASNLTMKYQSLGVTFSTSDINNWIDQNGDGVVGKYTYQVTNATTTSTFTLPADLVALLAGETITLSSGQLTVNGNVVSSAAIKAGDKVEVQPASGTNQSGTTSIYVQDGQTKEARFDFVFTAPVALQTGVVPTSVALDSSYVYWSNSMSWSANTSSVYRVPLNGGTPTSLVSNVQYTNALLVDSSNVYWQTNSGTSKASINGGTATHLAYGYSTPIAQDANFLYQAFSPNGVEKVSKSTGTVTQIASDTAVGAAPYAIAVDANNVYWANYTGNIRAVSKKG